MKKVLYITVLVLVITILLGTAMPALAAWLGGVRGEALVKEPITSRNLTLEEQKVFPGQEVSWQMELNNTAQNVTYGIIYDVWAYYDYYGSIGVGSFGAQETVRESTKQKEELALEAEMAGGMSTVSTNLGKLTLLVDPDGPAGPLPEKEYALGNVINIQPQGVHTLTLKLNVSFAAYPGNVVAYVQPFRTNPTQ